MIDNTLLPTYKMTRKKHFLKFSTTESEIINLIEGVKKTHLNRYGRVDIVQTGYFVLSSEGVILNISDTVKECIKQAGLLGGQPMLQITCLNREQNVCS